MDGALASLRAQIIRDGAPGIACGGDDSSAGGELQHVALKNKRTLRRGALKRIILAPLRTGPKTTREVASTLQAMKPELGDKAAHMTISMTLSNMKVRGMDGRAETLGYVTKLKKALRLGKFSH